MSRDPFSNEPEMHDRAGRAPVQERGASRARTGDLGTESQPVASRASGRRPDLEGSVRAYYLRERAYLLRESEFTTLVEIGKFRLIDSKDLAQFVYAGDAKRTDRELRHLTQQGLVAVKSIRGGGRGREELLVLTPRAKRLLLQSGRLPEGQAIYHGFVKPRDAKHDAALYRLYQRESARIESEGGRPVRVVLDYELQRNLHRELAQLEPAGQSREARERVAAKHGLVLVTDTVQIPDLRLEYETAEHEPKHIDLELATRNYRPRALAQKVKAGFSVYAAQEDVTKLRRILDAREPTARILSL
jgi:hypothetical protein